MLINFYVVKFLPLSISVLLMNTSALFVPILLLFSVKNTAYVLGIKLDGLCGCLDYFAFQPKLAHFEPVYVLIGLGGAIIGGDGVY